MTTITYRTSAERKAAIIQREAAGETMLHDNFGNPNELVFEIDTRTPKPKRQLTQRDFIDELAERNGITLI